MAHGEKLRANGSGLAKSDLTELKRRDVIKKAGKSDENDNIWEAGKLIGKYIESMGGLGMKIELKRSKNAPYVWINSELRPLAAKALDRAMSYEVTPYDSEPFVVRLFRGGKNGGYFFPIGLTDVAQTILSQIGYETQFFAGQRPAKKFDFTWHGPELWPHQKRAVSEAKKELGKGLGCTLHIPTRGGKTTAALWLVKELGVSTLVVVHTQELLRQWRTEIKKQLGVDAGYIRESTRNIKPITIAMVQTLRGAIQGGEKFDFDFLIVDETHHYSSKMFWFTVMRLNSFYRLALTATPRREDGQDMKFIGAVGKLIHPVSISELIERGVLVKPRFEFHSCECASTYENWTKAYTKGIVKNTERNEKIRDLATKHLKEGKQVYIHVTRIDHGKILARLIEDSIFVSGRDKSEWREQVLRDFKEKKIQCVISTLLGEGVDIPTMDVIINAASGKSWTTYVQRLGRVLTASEGKTEALVIDFEDYGNRWLRDHAARRREIVEEMFGGS